MGCITCILFLVAIVLAVIKVYAKLTSGWCRSNVCLVGKTTIVTGANTGIGYETAADFAKRGAKVILACRDPTRGQDAVDRIIKATDNKNVFFKQLDLSSFKSVRDFADDINKTEARLDILVNNAGAVGYPRMKSEDGLLLVMQINYFGPFLLTNLLLDLIKKTPNSRIVNVSSRGASHVKNLDINNLNSFPEDVYFQDIKVYCRTKLCNILFTIELAERLRKTSVTTYSLHPGVILTEINRTFAPWRKVIIETLINWFGKDCTEGAQTTIYCSVAKGIESLSGEIFEDCHVVAKYKGAQDPELPKKLWSITEDLLKLKSE